MPSPHLLGLLDTFGPLDLPSCLLALGRDIPLVVLLPGPSLTPSLTDPSLSDLRTWPATELSPEPSHHPVLFLINLFQTKTLN